MARYLWLKVYGWNKNVWKDIKLDHKNVVVGFFVLTFAKSEEFLFCDGTINYAKTFFLSEISWKLDVSCICGEWYYQKPDFDESA